MTTTKTIPVSRFNDGTPRKFTDFGGYPIFYVTKADNCLCPGCAAAEEDPTNDDPVIATDANWEDPALNCDACGARIESAYAEDEAKP